MRAMRILFAAIIVFMSGLTQSQVQQGSISGLLLVANKADKTLGIETVRVEYG